MITVAQRMPVDAWSEAESHRGVVASESRKRKFVCHTSGGHGGDPYVMSVGDAASIITGISSIGNSSGGRSHVDTYPARTYTKKARKISTSSPTQQSPKATTHSNRSPKLGARPIVKEESSIQQIKSEPRQVDDGDGTDDEDHHSRNDGQTTMQQQQGRDFLARHPSHMQDGSKSGSRSPLPMPGHFPHGQTMFETYQQQAGGSNPAAVVATNAARYNYFGPAAMMGMPPQHFYGYPPTPQMMQGFPFPPASMMNYGAIGSSRNMCDMDVRPQNYETRPSVKTCICCGRTNTPLWRDIGVGRPLCNACGIRWNKYGIICSGCNYVPTKQERQYVHCVRCQAVMPEPVATRRSGSKGQQNKGQSKDQPSQKQQPKAE